MIRRATLAGVLAWAVLLPGVGQAQITVNGLGARPDAVVDLRTEAGIGLVGAEWRYRDVTVTEVAHRSPGPDLRPSGPPNRTHDISPRAGEEGFDDGDWDVIAPTSLEDRRSGGLLSFGWYRIEVTIPDRLAGFDPAGSTVVFEIVVDDYAEVWVDGKLPVVLGQSGEGLVGGWNTPQRVVIGRNVRPGQRIQLAVFAANGPLSAPPPNYVWVRSATLDFYGPGRLSSTVVVETTTVRDDPRLDDVVPPGAQVEKLADGFLFTEGPVWVPAGPHLLFSDPNANRIYRWTPDGAVSVFRTKSGYAGADIGAYGQPGSNGLTLDADGRLTIAEHGNRRVTRLENNGIITVLADRYEGRRLNSPNDLVYRSDGALYFTDPPFGLPRAFDDPAKELPFSGVYMLKDGMLRLVASDLSGPNGLAFSPREDFLYVTNWDLERKVVMRYPVAEDGSLGPGAVFFDMTGTEGAEALDGVKVDRAGNLFVSGPGGLWVIAPDGTGLGRIVAPELPANLAWGDPERRTLYMTARTGLYRLSLGGQASLTHATR